MKRHAIDVFSLVSGLIVVATAAVLLSADPDVTVLVRYWPLAIIAIGVALLFSGNSKRDDAEPAEAAAGQAGGASHLHDTETVQRDDAYDAYDDGLARTDIDRLDDEDVWRNPSSDDADSTRRIPRTD